MTAATPSDMMLAITDNTHTNLDTFLPSILSLEPFSLCLSKNKTKYKKAIEILVFWVFFIWIRVFVAISLIVTLLWDFRERESERGIKSMFHCLREKQIKRSRKSNLEQIWVWVLLLVTRKIQENLRMILIFYSWEIFFFCFYFYFYNLNTDMEFFND